MINKKYGDVQKHHISLDRRNMKAVTYTDLQNIKKQEEIP